MLAACNPLITPDGILCVHEVFSRNGLKPIIATKATPMGYPLINRHGERELTTEFTHSGRRRVFGVNTATGNRIVATASHRNLVMNEFGFWVWKEQQDMTPGDYLVMSRKYATAIGQRAEMSDGELYFLGTLLADGSFSPSTPNRIGVTNNDPCVIESILTHGRALFGFAPHQYEKQSEGSLDFHFNSKEAVQRLYEKTGWARGLAKDKNLGSMVRQLSTDQMRLVLQGYYDCECSIDKLGIEASSASWKLLFEIKTVLQAHFGIVSVLKEKVVAAYPHNDYWRLMLYGQSAIDYLDRVGFRSEVRNREAEKLDRNKDRNPNLDVVPGCGVLLNALYDSSETSSEHKFMVGDYKGDHPRSNPGYKKLAEILSLPWDEGAPLQRLREIADPGYFYDRVVSVEQMAPEATFNFVFAGSHSFNVANIITHSSTVTQPSTDNHTSPSDHLLVGRAEGLTAPGGGQNYLSL